MDKYHRINQIINRNPAKFLGDVKITDAWLKRSFDWLVPGLATADRNSSRDVLKFVAAYTTINKVLAKRGQYLKARNYYKEFKLCNTKSTVTTVANTYRQASLAKQQRGSQLTMGFNRHAGLWTPLTTEELNSFRQ